MKYVIVSLLCLTSTACFALPEIEYTGGHADVGINYEDGAWDFHFHAEGAIIDGVEDVEGEYAPDQVLIVVPDHATAVRPEGAQWDFIGIPAESLFYVLPQHAEHDGHEEEEGDHDHTTPFLGIGTEELASGIFIDDQITLSLVSVSGPGQFSLWQVDAFGSPTVFMSSADPEAQTDLALTAGLHGHYNWGFTEEGIYEITLMASGQLTDGSTVSDTATYTFSVVPEPATLLLLVTGSIGLMRQQRKG